MSRIVCCVLRIIILRQPSQPSHMSWVFHGSSGVYSHSHIILYYHHPQVHVHVYMPSSWLGLSYLSHMQLHPSPYMSSDNLRSYPPTWLTAKFLGLTLPNFYYISPLFFFSSSLFCSYIHVCTIHVYALSPLWSIMLTVSRYMYHISIFCFPKCRSFSLCKTALKHNFHNEDDRCHCDTVMLDQSLHVI